jgi:hypothetical protein
LKIYNTIPTKEILDPDFLRGFAREIYFYFQSGQFEDPNYALYLLDVVDRFIDHLRAQVTVGKKFVSTTEPPASGNDFEVYYSETLNGTTNVLFSSDDFQGLYIGHNMMNSLFTTDKFYIEESQNILNKQMAISSIISVVNEKQRNIYFSGIKRMVDSYRQKIKTELFVQ